MASAHDTSDAARALRDALREHEADLYRFVRARVPSGEAKDVFQLAAVRAIERVHTLKDAERVLPWLYRVFRNVVVDDARKRASQGRMIDSAVSATDLAGPASVPHNFVESICQCSLGLARKLNGAHASILALVDEGDATIKEAAEILGLTANNATVRLHRARKALRLRLLEHCGVRSLRDCADCRCDADGCCPVTH